MKEADALLQPHLARKRLQDEELARMGKPFSVKAVCVFDTVSIRSLFFGYLFSNPVFVPTGWYTGKASCTTRGR